MASAPISFISAKEIYKTENGYRAINNYLSRSVHKHETKYKNRERMENPNANTLNDGTPISEIVFVLRKGMIPLETSHTYYRGGSCHGKMTYRLETFLSVTDDEKQAQSYKKNGGCLFEVKVDEGIRCTRYAAEKETLLEDKCYWEYIGQNPRNGNHIVHVHSPEWEHSQPIPWKGDATLPLTEENIRKKMMNNMLKENINWNAEGGKRRTRKRRQRKSTRRQRKNIFKLFY